MHGIYTFQVEYLADVLQNDGVLGALDLLNEPMFRNDIIKALFPLPERYKLTNYIVTDRPKQLSTILRNSTTDYYHCAKAGTAKYLFVLT